MVVGVVSAEKSYIECLSVMKEVSWVYRERGEGSGVEEKKKEGKVRRKKRGEEVRKMWGGFPIYHSKDEQK